MPARSIPASTGTSGRSISSWRRREPPPPGRGRGRPPGRAATAAAAPAWAAVSSTGHVAGPPSPASPARPGAGGSSTPAARAPRRPARARGATVRSRRLASSVSIPRAAAGEPEVAQRVDLRLEVVGVDLDRRVLEERPQRRRHLRPGAARGAPRYRWPSGTYQDARRRPASARPASGIVRGARRGEGRAQPHLAGAPGLDHGRVERRPAWSRPRWRPAPRGGGAGAGRSRSSRVNSSSVKSARARSVSTGRRARSPGP